MNCGGTVSGGIRRIGLIGDVHGEHERLGDALDWLRGQRLDCIVCTGDVADGVGCVNVCCELLYQADVVTVAGNHDRWLLQNRVRHLEHAHAAEDLTDASRAFLTGLQKTERVGTVGGEVMLCHGILDNDLGKVWPGTPRTAIERSAKLDAWLAESRCRLMLNGHLHYRVLIDFEQLILINAGTLRGEHGGVCVLDVEQGVVTGLEFAARRLQRVSEHSLYARTERRVWSDTQAFDATWNPVTLYR